MSRMAWIAGGIVAATAGTLIARRLRTFSRSLDEELAQAPDDEIVRDYAVDDDGWAFDAANDALDRLALASPQLARFHVRVVWLSRALAFTVPGRALYISRALMDRPGFSAGPTAFVLAHEAAHHVLGHFGDDTLGGALGARLGHLWLGAANELAADAFALRACLRAGYARDDVMRVFDILEMYAEDYGRRDGPEDQRSLLERLRGHPPVHARRDALRDVT